MKVSKKFSKLLETVDVSINEDETPSYPLNRQAIKYLNTVEGKEYKLAIVSYEDSTYHKSGVIYCFLSSDKSEYCEITHDDNGFGTMNRARFTGKFIKWV
jgi:hypothetical protein